MVADDWRWRKLFCRISHFVGVGPHFGISYLSVITIEIQTIFSSLLHVVLLYLALDHLQVIFTVDECLFVAVVHQLVVSLFELVRLWALLRMRLQLGHWLSMRQSVCFLHHWLALFRDALTFVAHLWQRPPSKLLACILVESWNSDSFVRWTLNKLSSCNRRARLGGFHLLSTLAWRHLHAPLTRVVCVEQRDLWMTALRSDFTYLLPNRRRLPSLVQLLNLFEVFNIHLLHLALNWSLHRFLSLTWLTSQRLTLACPGALKAAKSLIMTRSCFETLNFHIVGKLCIRAILVLLSTRAEWGQHYREITIPGFCRCIRSNSLRPLPSSIFKLLWHGILSFD